MSGEGAEPLAPGKPLPSGGPRVEGRGGPKVSAKRHYSEGPWRAGAIKAE